MASTPPAEHGFRPTLERMGAAWNNFFFKPRDPSTLGLMRIMAGVFILYIVIAHTWDLYNFFGKHAWVDLKMVDSQRKEYPFPAPTWGWTDSTLNVAVPPDRQVREAFLLRWAQNLPVDWNQRREALTYVINLLPLTPPEPGEGLAFAQQLLIRAPGDNFRVPLKQFRSTTEEERQRMLDALTRDQIAPGERHLVPSFMHSMTVDQRKQIAEQLNRFVRTMPSNPGDVAMIFAHLNNQSFTPLPVQRPGDPSTELQRTIVFLTGRSESSAVEDARGPFMPDAMQERREVLEYLNTWSVDPRRTFVRGFYIFSVWYHVTDPFWMAVVHGGILVVIAMFAAGLWTRVTSVIAWLGVLSYVHRNGNILFGMDTMANIAMFYLMIGPSGAALSVDRWLEKRRARRELERARAQKRDTSQWEAILAGPRQSSLAGFVTRMVQIHFCFIYAASGLSKLKGPAWWNHTAVWYTMANPEFSPTVFQPYMWALTKAASTRWLSELMMSFGSVYTLFLEIAFPFLVWRPLLRPYMVIAGVLLHTGIAIFMGLTVFGLFMLVLLMSYIPPETVKRWIELGEKKPAKPSDSPASGAVLAAAKV